MAATIRPWQGMFLEHPIGSVEGMDPLLSFDAEQFGSGELARPRIGYGMAFWEKVPERTWSGTAWNLREGLRKWAEVVDIGLEPSRLTRAALKYGHARYIGGRLTTSYYESAVTDAYVRHELKRGLRRNFKGSRCDAILAMGRPVALDGRFYMYSDVSIDSQIVTYDTPARMASQVSLTERGLWRRRNHQVEVYQQATGIFAESHWWKRSLIEQSGIPAEKIHVVHPALVAGKSLQNRVPLRKRSAPRRKLLYVGRQHWWYCFYRKAGDLVVDALEILRRDYDPQITLTMVGMEKWPLPGSPPPGVDFRGILSPEETGELFDSHDLFVMPSRLEGFGLVFVEAQSRGMPCVARSAYAMPEIVTPGVSGAFIERDDPHELAATIVSVLEDDGLYEKCYERAPAIAAYYSWERAAHQMVEVISKDAGLAF